MGRIAARLERTASAMLKLNCTIALSLVTTACGSSGGGSANVGGANLQGVWMEKDNADELRQTGRLDSLCPEIRKNPQLKIVNVRLIAGDGSVYLYDPSIGANEYLKMGSLNSNGVLVLSDAFKGQAANGTLTVQAKGANIVFTIPGWSSGIEYVRSTDQEASRYFDAQNACRHPWFENGTRQR